MNSHPVLKCSEFFGGPILLTSETLETLVSEYQVRNKSFGSTLVVSVDDEQKARRLVDLKGSWFHPEDLFIHVEVDPNLEKGEWLIR